MRGELNLQEARLVYFLKWPSSIIKYFLNTRQNFHEILIIEDQNWDKVLYQPPPRIC